MSCDVGFNSSFTLTSVWHARTTIEAGSTHAAGLGEYDLELNGIRLDLRIMDFECSPEIITGELGIEPTRTWLKGEMRGTAPLLKHKENGWEISSGLQITCEFEEHLKALVAIIESRRDAFERICNLYYSEISCAVYISEDDENVSTPWINVPKESMRILGAIGTGIDFDMYRFGIDE